MRVFLKIFDISDLKWVIFFKHQKLVNSTCTMVSLEFTKLLQTAASGNRTRTLLPERDFKSRASTSSAMAAYHLYHDTRLQIDFQGLFL